MLILVLMTIFGFDIEILSVEVCLKIKMASRKEPHGIIETYRKITF